MKNILLVEDDELMNKMVSNIIRNSGYKVFQAYSLREANNFLATKHLDLIILDINLPDGSGYNFLKVIQSTKAELPIIILTANDLKEDIIRGYQSGAVEYITKPFSNEILLLKIKSIFNLLAASKESHSGKLDDIYDNGDLKVNFSRLCAEVDRNSLELSPFEFQILKIFIKNKNTLLTRNKLMDLLWGSSEDFVEEHTLTAAISRLRRKIDCGEKKYIQTVYGMGYMFIEGESNEK
ncbi:DNA-binding response regulator, OmpR family, contains REC and winged-helix (wHTH) domain [Anaerosphaera aminiphila DSM 21120]|uniref:DNA-binding response regulator, OmpR family, contains REC and winged-helix (WHTH) domain n=1 Tax=Anaerosphaera aminiphila DSM 21120 TaxID=1120995 RepID=A0A1M5PJL0_9FIRM|nr:response regulator transcription factor [Anaerosphaera aminiphila]SHH01982.1 DNA-binding response regulator, OmpR family, contains REC and winged-helix (wHTH) domain [Anaerosphaera aminiphila DSM 21120]